MKITTKKKLDAIFSKYIRLKYSVNGYCTCYTCGHRDYWKKLQNGHLVSRYYLPTRYDEDNCRPQCYVCNIIRNGMIPDFSKKLEEELGEGITKKLYKKASEVAHDFDYDTLIKEYTIKVNQLLAQTPEPL